MTIIDKGDGVGNDETVDVGSAVKLPHATEFTELDGDGRRRWSESERAPDPLPIDLNVPLPGGRPRMTTRK
jgi:hypothetical protein